MCVLSRSNGDNGGDSQTNVQEGTSEQGAYRRKSSSRVAPAPQRPQMTDKLCQTDPCDLEPLGPNIGVQTSEDDWCIDSSLFCTVIYMYRSFMNS